MTRMRRGVVLQGVDAVDEFLSMATRVEAMGFDHLWLTESSLHARDPYQLLSLAARATTKIRIGTAVTNPVTRHPALATLEASIAAIRALMAGETVTSDGPGFALVQAHMRFGAQSDLPVFVSASGPRTLELAGAIADGVILLCGLDPAVVNWALERVDAGAAKAGRARPHIALFVYGVIDEDEEVAIAGARPIAAWFPQTAPAYCDLVGLDPDIARQVRETYQGGEFQEASRAAQLLPADFVQKMAVAGNRDRFTSQLVALEETGVDSVHILPMGDDRMATVLAFDECWSRLQ
ncbi:MAG: 5,10-methylenetetrahydromethanopterin reductase [Verrucomicrobiales bacterium]|jgi:5,10-methylenetetrahydromethanopterin reductase